MRRLLMPLLALVFAVPAWAGPHLRWDAPFGHPDAQTNKNFACDTNVGEDVLVVSFWAPDSVADVRGYLVELDGTSAQTTLPDWWRISECRSSSSLSVDPSAAPDWPVGVLPGAVVGGVDYAMRFNFSHFRLRFTVQADTLQPLHSIGPRSGEQFVGRVQLKRQRTVGTGSCSGCPVQVCISHAKVTVDGRRLDGLPLPPSWEGFASIDQQHWVTWQGGGPFPCPAAVPASPSSWGRIKASYR